MKIAREGYPLIFTAVVLTLLAFAAGWIPLGIILGLIGLAVVGFFRDPERQPPAGEGLVVSPADGKVVSIAGVKGDSPFLVARQESASFFRLLMCTSTGYPWRVESKR
jgi:phosphatidylserine decarboxylase